MSFRRMGRFAAMVVATVVCVSCGQIYRPVVLPTVTTPPNPANFHSVFGLNVNLPGNPGAAVQISVSGDVVVGQTPSDANSPNVGINPTHVAILPNNSRVFVASAGSMFPNGTDNFSGTDVVASFTPSPDSTVFAGLGSVFTFTLPNVGAGQSSSIAAISESGNLVTVMVNAALGNARVGDFIAISGVGIAGYDGSFPISFVSGTTIQYVNSNTGLAPSSGGTATLPSFCAYLPDFVATSQNTAVYVANYGVENGANCNLTSTDSVAVLNTAQNTISNIVPLAAGAHPVAMAETPDGRKLYVANQGNNSVSSFNTVDMSPNTVVGFSGTTPVWVVARNDNRRVYVLTQGDGQLVTLDEATDTILPTLSNTSVGVGANFATYDPHLNRLYVANPANGTVYVFSTTGGLDPATQQPNDTPTLLKAITITGLCATCTPAAPTQVTALRDGSRFYVASYQTAAACPDPNVAGTCLVPQLTVFDANSFAVKTSLFLLATPVFNPIPPNPQPYAVPPVASCAPAATFRPGTTRFRLTVAAAADSSRVYVGICDAGAVAVINTTTSTVGTTIPDTLVLDLLAPFSNAAPQSNGEPPPQNPIFLITGQ